MPTDLTREEFLLLVRESPSQELAQELGISDVALAKVCMKLQAPWGLLDQDQGQGCKATAQGNLRATIIR